MQTSASKSITLFETEYSVRLEYNKDYAIFHMPYVNKFTPNVYKDMVVKLEDWYEFFSTLGYNGIYAALDENNSKMIRLLNKLGFVYVNKDPNSGFLVFRYFKMKEES